MKKPNPQGKGLVPILEDMRPLQVRVGGAKAPEQLLRDYFISSLILSARFRLRPVVGRDYFLYAAQPRWLLSLISPDQWHGAPPGEFVGRCTLRTDMTWELHARNLEGLPAVSKDIVGFIEAFIERITEQDSVAASLPFYLSTLPYHQRMLATALAASLKYSLRDSGDNVNLLLADKAKLQRLLGHAQPSAR